MEARFCNASSTTYHLLTLLGQFGRKQRISLRDPEAQARFLES